MKKITAYIFTVLLSTVGAANADIASTGYVDSKTGKLGELNTTEKSNLVGAINELGTTVGGLDSTVTGLDSKVTQAQTAASNAKSAADAAQNTADAAQTAANEAKQAAAQAGTTAANTYVIKNEAIQGATNVKITYDDKGLVTAGAGLEVSDIPTLTSGKISDFDDQAKAAVATVGYALTSQLPGTATTEATGLVKPDGTTITVGEDGTIAAQYTDNDTTYSNGNGLNLAGTVFSVKPTEDGTISVTESGVGVGSIPTSKVTNFDTSVQDLAKGAISATNGTNGGVSASYNAGVITVDGTPATNEAYGVVKLATGVGAEEQGVVTGAQVQSAINGIDVSNTVESGVSSALAGLAVTATEPNGQAIVKVAQENGRVAATLGTISAAGLGTTEGTGKYVLTKDEATNAIYWEEISR